jgi:hypothetical protein
VLRAVRYGFHRQDTILVVTFSEDMNSDAASNPANYTVLVSARGTHRAVPISRAFYDSDTRQATLRVAEKIYLYRPWQLALRDNITDLSGNPLDPNVDGVTGRDSVIKMTRHSLVGRASHAPGASRVGVKAVPAGPLGARVLTDRGRWSMRAPVRQAGAAMNALTSTRP